MSFEMWADLSVRHLLALRAVAQEGTFGRAADRLGFTQSAVSQQVAALEQLVDAKLFDRPSGPRPPTLTRTGELLLEHAHRVLAHLERAENEVARFARGEAGRLAIGTFQSASTRLLPAILLELRQASPGVEVFIDEDEPRDDYRSELLLRGDLDLAFVNDAPVGDFDGRFIVADPYVAVVPIGEPEGSIDLASVAERPLVGMPVGDRCGRPVERFMEELGQRPNFVFRSHDNGAVQAMVGAGVGIAFAPLLTVDASDATTEIRPLVPAPEPREIWLIWPKNRSLSPLAHRCVEVAERVGSQFARDALIV